MSKHPRNCRRTRSACPGFPRSQSRHGWRLWLLVFATALARGLPLVAQPLTDSPPKRLVGSPSFSVYEPTTTGVRAGIQSLSLDGLGRILITSGYRLIAFDGNSWNTYIPADPSLQRESFIVHRVATAPDGALYCSASDGIHRIELLADDRYELTALASRTDFFDRGVASLRDAIAHGPHIYFYGLASIARVDTRDQSVAFIHETLDTIASIAFHDDQLYAFGANGEAFARIEEAWVELDVQEEAEFREGLRAAESWPDRGLMLAPDIRSLKRLDPELGIVHWPSELDDLETRRVLDLEPISPSALAVSVANTGIFLLDAQGEVLQVLDRSIDYRFGQARKLLHLDNGVVWAISDRSLIRVDFLAPLTDVSILLPYASTFPRLLWHRGILHVVSDEKIVQAQRYRGGAIRGFVRRGASIEDQIINAISVEEGILCAAVNAVYLLRDDDSVEWVADLPQTTLLVRHPDFPEQAVAIGGENYYLLERRDGAWGYSGLAKPSPGFSYEAERDSNGVSWVELGVGRVARLVQSDGNFEVDVFDARDGLGPFWINLWKLDEQVYFNVGANLQVLAWSAAEGAFQSAELEIVRRLWLRYPGVSRPAADSLGNIWVPTNANHAVLRLQPDGSYLEDTLTLGSVQNEVLLRALAAGEGRVWLAGTSKIYHYDPQRLAPPANPPLTRLFRIEDPDHGVILYDWRRSPAPAEGLRIPYRYNDLLIKVTTPTIAHRQDADHQYFIEGRSVAWSSLPAPDQLPLSNLREGRYHVRIRPVFGHTPGEEVAIAFEVLPPFYRSGLAYLLYALLAAATLMLIMVALRNRAERRNHGLQRLVALRTRELESANTELKQLVRRAESATTAKTTFLHNVSHEMRTPLNGIIGPASLVLQQLEDGEARSFVEIIRDSAERLRKIIEELLVFSENEAYSARSDVSEFNLRELVGQLREEFAPDAIRRGLELKVAITPRTPRYWHGDPAKIRQALRILLENAIKFTESGSVNLRTSRESDPEGRSLLVFEVADTGIGFGQEMRSRLFEPFQQEQDSLSGKHEGTGIGLAICQQLALSMDGVIEAHSEPGKGSLFRLAVPLSPRLTAER